MQAKEQKGVRTRLIQAAVNLAYRQGFGNTTLAQIAKEARVPQGNLYYYFKTKEEIASAIVEQRLSELSMLQQELGRIQDPKERLSALVRLRLRNLDAVSQYGCPVGTFCTELNKDIGISVPEVSKIFNELLEWVEAQFREFCSKSDARRHAVHVISTLQGVTVLASCTKNPQLMELETKRLEEWIRSI